VAGDVCGKDSICHLSKPIANTSCYYLGGCTDPTYKDPAARNIAVSSISGSIPQKVCMDVGKAVQMGNERIIC
jgi:hypothetical protein